MGILLATLSILLFHMNVVNSWGEDVAALAQILCFKTRCIFGRAPFSMEANRTSKGCSVFENGGQNRSILFYLRS